MSLTVDFHSHILCGVDHGSRDAAESRAQLELMAESGTDIAVATSHFYPNATDIQTFVSAVDGAIAKISALELRSAPKLCIGAEVLV